MPNQPEIYSNLDIEEESPHMQVPKIIQKRSQEDYLNHNIENCDDEFDDVLTKTLLQNSIARQSIANDQIIPIEMGYGHLHQSHAAIIP